jgi:hypothetical protein
MMTQYTIYEHSFENSVFLVFVVVYEQQSSIQLLMGRKIFFSC